MFFKIITLLSLIFVLVMILVFGVQLHSLAAQIGTKDRSGIFNLTMKLQPSIINTVTINEYSLVVDVADEPKTRANGLMHRQNLGRTEGMLFVFPREGIYSFWMKNMNFPLDIIWVNSSLEVVHIERNVAPCLDLVCPKYFPLDDAQYVVEANAGWAKRANVEVGSKVEFK